MMRSLGIVKRQSHANETRAREETQPRYKLCRHSSSESSLQLYCRPNRSKSFQADMLNYTQRRATRRVGENYPAVSQVQEILIA
jgi:hypothetical protein